MTEIDQLLATIKRRLKTQGMTYGDLAVAIGVSEPTVKRMFATRRFGVDRLVEIANLLGFTLSELSQEAAVSGNRLHVLTDAQEKELVSDQKLLLVAVCVLNQWTVAEIERTYRLSEAECIRRLVKLDHLRLIQLLPGNRVRLNVARDFDWLPQGPIRSYFLAQGLGDFLHSEFLGDDEVMAFSHGMLTDTAITKVQIELRKLRQRFAELHEESLAAPLAKRRGCGMLLAMREWELAAFTSFRRT
jgi:transcriptional regulator with XRE-family HTH domain